MHAEDSLPSLTPDLATRLARVALANVAREYPFHSAVLMANAADARSPREHHPVFFGSYDWHSCVHMHWTLARCARREPTLLASIEPHFNARFTATAVNGELAFFNAPGRATFERPYGWGWLLKLSAELHMLAQSHAAAAPWRDALTPLAQHLALQMIDWLPRQQWPVRAGTHGNTAFALLLALDYADAVQHRALTQAIERFAHARFGGDTAYPAAYEPSGDDFLSGGLVEAALMARLAGECDGFDWWLRFRPRDLSPWLTPVTISDATDAKMVHLHGLNLSRAWCWRQLCTPGEHGGAILPDDDRAAARAAIQSHIKHSLAAATDGDYVGTHWLASFALLALDGKT